MSLPPCRSGLADPGPRRETPLRGRCEMRGDPPLLNPGVAGKLPGSIFSAPPVQHNPTASVTQGDAAMSTPTSIAQIDLTPPLGRTYFQSEREWREEFIYFLLVDRFHDDQPRACAPTAGRSAGGAVADDFYGGHIRGVHRKPPHLRG